MPGNTTYDRPQTERYSLLALAFGGTTASRTFQGPPGKKGLVRDIIIDVTTAMVGTTSVPELRVGSAASDNTNARWLLGTTAILGYGTGEFRARSLCATAQGRTGGRPEQLADFAHHIFLEGNDGSGSVAGVAGTGTQYAFLAADTAFFITGVAGVGGGIAGTADIFVDIDWF